MPVSIKTNRSTVDLNSAQDDLQTAILTTTNRQVKDDSNVNRCNDTSSPSIPANSDLDALVEALRAKLGVSWACVTLMDKKSQDCKPTPSMFRATASAANRGLDYAKLSHDFSFGENIMESESDMLIIPDTLQDNRYRNHALVNQAPNFRFLAGVALNNVDGSKIGSLCILNDTPVTSLSVEQQHEIQRTARSISNILAPKSKDEVHPLRKRCSFSDLRGAEVDASTVLLPDPCVGQSKLIVPKALVSGDVPSLNGKRSRSNSLVRRGHHETNTPRATVSTMLPLILPNPGAGNNTDPDEFLLQIVSALYPNIQFKRKPALDLDGFFDTITEEQMSHYSMEIVNAARANDLATLKKIHKDQGPGALACFNRFGEGLLNMACRRGFTEMVHFFLDEVHLSVRVRDDYGRTPLHDACWSAEPQLKICTWIMAQEPSLFLVTDKRGFTPFQYARECDWPIWRQFLVDNLDLLHKLASPESSALFS